jgi:hypothetical protein
LLRNPYESRVGPLYRPFRVEHLLFNVDGLDAHPFQQSSGLVEELSETVIHRRVPSSNVNALMPRRVHRYVKKMAARIA